MSTLDFVNQFILQWAFIRIAKTLQQGGVIRYSIMYWVYPLSGYGAPFKYTKSGRRYALNIYIY